MMQSHIHSAYSLWGGGGGKKKTVKKAVAR